MLSSDTENSVIKAYYGPYKSTEKMSSFAIAKLNIIYS